MFEKRSVVLLMVIGMMGLALPLSAAEPIDTWETVGHRLRRRPVQPGRARTARKDPNGDPEPGSAEWNARDAERRECDNQRDHDRRGQPPVIAAAQHRPLRRGLVPPAVRCTTTCASATTTSRPAPAWAAFRRWRSTGRVRHRASAPSLPDGLERFDAPYPVVVVHHGFIAQMTHHRYNAQVFAEAGYLAIVVNGTHPVTGAPNVQRNVNGDLVLDWLASEASGEIGERGRPRPRGPRRTLAGLGRGAQLPGRPARGHDPRVGRRRRDRRCQHLAADHVPAHRRRVLRSADHGARPTTPETRDRGLATYQTHKERGLDVFHVTFRATNHIDWNGNGVGSLAGNRLCRAGHQLLQPGVAGPAPAGRCSIFDDDGEVVTSDRANRRRGAGVPAGAGAGRVRSTHGDAVRRLGDRHNISMGLFDPVQSLTPRSAVRRQRSVLDRWSLGHRSAVPGVPVVLLGVGAGLRERQRWDTGVQARRQRRQRGRGRYALHRVSRQRQEEAVAHGYIEPRRPRVLGGDNPRDAEGVR